MSLIQPLKFRTFQNAPFANAPFANGGYICLFGLLKSSKAIKRWPGVVEVSIFNMKSSSFEYSMCEHNAKQWQAVSLILSYLIISSLTAIKVNATFVGRDPLQPSAKVLLHRNDQLRLHTYRYKIRFFKKY